MKRGNVVFGILLIALGVIWILSNMNIINFDLFILIDSLFELWPLILIVIGINIIFSNKILNTVLWLVFIVVVIVHGFFINDASSNDEYIEETRIEMNEDTIKAEVNIDLGASSYDVNSMDTEEELAKIVSTTKFNYKEKTSNNRQVIDISNDISSKMLNNKNNIDVKLNTKIPWDIDVDTGASDGDLNLKNIKVQNLDLDLGAGNIDVYFGKMHPTTYVNIESGASKIVLNIPSEAGIKLKMDGALNSTNIDDLDLVKVDEDTRMSKDYTESEMKFDMNVDMGVGNFKINRY